MNAIEKTIIATLQQVATATSDTHRQLELTAAIQCIAGLRSGALLSLHASQAMKPRLEDLPLDEQIDIFSGLNGDSYR
ncbi:MAG: hypothetical protein Q8R95_07370 [Azonexus sp.]|nr:hypothetical protein [Azonexus sp.]